MKFTHLYNSIKNKAWELIEKKYFSESLKSYKLLNRFRLLYYSNIQLKKTKLLILFSIVIGSTTAIDESIVLYSICNTPVSLLVSENIGMIIKIIMVNIIPIIGFVGSLYLILRRSAGLWLIGIWSSLLIVPIFLSYNENGYLLSQNYFNYFNTSPLVQAFFITSESMTRQTGTDPLYNFNYIVKYSPFTSGIGVNFVPILYLLTVSLILFQNKKIFSLKKRIIFLLIIVFSTFVPFSIYSLANIFHDKKEDDFEIKRLKLQTPLKHYPNLQQSLHDKCFEFSRSWFNADDNQFIKEVTCYNDKEKVSFTK